MLYGKELNLITPIPWNRRDDHCGNGRRKCFAEEAFRDQLDKPPWLRSKAVMVACNCPKCKITY